MNLFNLESRPSALRKKTLTQGALKASGSERSRQCQTIRYHTVCIATPIAEPLKCFTLIANVAKSTNDFFMNRFYSDVY